MIACPNCGRSTAEGAFCSRCGAELEAVAPAEGPRSGAASSPSAPPSPSAPAPAPSSPPSSAPSLEYDKTCVLFEKLSGAMRFRFSAGGPGAQAEHLSVSFSNPLASPPPPFRVRRVRGAVEFPVQFPPQSAGLAAWEVRVEYATDARRKAFTGRFEALVSPVEPRKRVADNININIATNIGTVGHASDVSVNQRGAGELAALVSAPDPLAELRRIAGSDARDWKRVALSNDNAVDDLPPMPEGARADSAVFSFAGRRYRFVAKPTLKIGRKCDANDIVLLPASGAPDFAAAPYRKISRCHCFVECAGKSASVCDGARDDSGCVSPSKCGTFWNGERLAAPLSVSAGESGTLSFAGPREAGCVSAAVRAFSPAKACESCPHSNLLWCGEGMHPSLVFRRGDAPGETCVAMWSCFCFGNVEPALDGWIVFRKDGAFAYRRKDGKTGWLAPGSTVHTPLGPLTVMKGE